MLTGIELIIALLAVAVGATIMGTVSFGMGLVVAPVLLLFMAPKPAIVTVNAIIPILLLFVLLSTWRHLQLRRLAELAIGGVLAVPLGVLVLEFANPTVLRITIGIAILFLGVLNLLNIRLPLARRPGSGLLIGFLTALSITTISIGGPLAASYVIAQEWRREQMRAALAFYFICTYVVAFALYYAIGLVEQRYPHQHRLAPSIAGSWIRAGSAAGPKDEGVRVPVRGYRRNHYRKPGTAGPGGFAGAGRVVCGESARESLSSIGTSRPSPMSKDRARNKRSPVKRRPLRKRQRM